MSSTELPQHPQPRVTRFCVAIRCFSAAASVVESAAEGNLANDEGAGAVPCLLPGAHLTDAVASVAAGVGAGGAGPGLGWSGRIWAKNCPLLAFLQLPLYLRLHPLS